MMISRPPAQATIEDTLRLLELVKDPAQAAGVIADMKKTVQELNDLSAKNSVLAREAKEQRALLAEIEAGISKQRAAAQEAMDEALREKERAVQLKRALEARLGSVAQTEAHLRQQEAVLQKEQQAFNTYVADKEAQFSARLSEIARREDAVSDRMDKLKKALAE